MYILDTDSISLMFRFPGVYEHLERRVENTPQEHIYISVISVEEAIQGAFILKNNRHNPVGCYNLLGKIVTYYGKFQILSYNEGPMAIFNGFSAAVRRAGGSTSDRQIAATALHYGYTVITRNTDDYTPTAARCLDWTRA